MHQLLCVSSRAGPSVCLRSCAPHASVSSPPLSPPVSELGWDVFSLQYQVRGPLATVFTPKAMSAYLRVFHLLWSLKRAEAALAGCWTTLQCEVGRPLHKLGAGGSGLDEIQRRSRNTEPKPAMRRAGVETYPGRPGLGCRCSHSSPRDL